LRTEKIHNSLNDGFGTYNLDFDLIESVMEPLIGSSDDLGNLSPRRTSMFHVVAFRLTEDLACLEQLFEVEYKHHSEASDIRILTTRFSIAGNTSIGWSRLCMSAILNLRKALSEHWEMGQAVG